MNTVRISGINTILGIQKKKKGKKSCNNIRIVNTRDACPTGETCCTTAASTALSHCPVPDLNYSLGVQVDCCLLELLTKLMDRKNSSEHMIVFVDIVQQILVCKSFILTFIMPGGCIFFIAFLITCGKKHLTCILLSVENW